MAAPPTAPLPPDVLAAEVEGRNFPSRRFGDLLGPAPTLLSFLRHFG